MNIGAVPIMRRLKFATFGTTQSWSLYHRGIRTEDVRLKYRPLLSSFMPSSVEIWPKSSTALLMKAVIVLSDWTVSCVHIHILHYFNVFVSPLHLTARWSILKLFRCLQLNMFAVTGQCCVNIMIQPLKQTILATKLNDAPTWILIGGIWENSVTETLSYLVMLWEIPTDYILRPHYN